MKLIRKALVIERTGLSQTTIYRLMAEGKFPRQVQINEHSVGWLESEIDDWIAARVAARDGAEGRAA